MLRTIGRRHGPATICGNIRLDFANGSLLRHLARGVIQICWPPVEGSMIECRRRACARALLPLSGGARGCAGERAVAVRSSVADGRECAHRQNRARARSPGVRGPVRLFFPASESLSPEARARPRQLPKSWRRRPCCASGAGLPPSIPDAGAASTWIFVIARNLRIDRASWAAARQR